MKESKEALVGLLKLSAEIAKLAKDGVQLSDAVALAAKLNEEPLKSAVAQAVDGLSKVPDEVKEFKVLDLVELLPAVLPELEKLVEELKRK